MSFSGKVVLVTGASSGIGAATAIHFAREGAEVIMVGRNQTKLKKVADIVKSVGNPPLVIIAELAKEVDIIRVIKETIGKYGKLDILVNNAGISKNGSVTGQDILPAFDAVMAVNVRAVIHLSSLALPYLKTSKGNIVNVSSISSMSTPVIPDLMSYSISKAALDSFTKGLAKEAAPHVRVNSVNPGPVVTDFFTNNELQWDVKNIDFSNINPLGRASQSEEIAELIAFLASDKARGITGSLYVVDNGVLIK